MFTGLVAATGRLVSVRKVGQELDLTVDLGPVAEAADLGASIAISGVCCTVTARRGPNADFRLSKETLDRTWLGRAKVGQLVNLEAALRAGDPLGSTPASRRLETQEALPLAASSSSTSLMPPFLRFFSTVPGVVSPRSHSIQNESSFCGSAGGRSMPGSLAVRPESPRSRHA